MNRTGIMEEAVERTDTLAGAVSAVPVAESSHLGGSRELLTLALPLVVSQSFMTVQVFVDTILLSHHDPREMAASSGKAFISPSWPGFRSCSWSRRRIG
jgi:multidrug resistance protein, MATE family